MNRASALTFGELEQIVAAGRVEGMSSVDPVMFCAEEGGSTTLFTVRHAEAQPQSSDGEGNVTSVGGTFWLRGTEY